MSDIRAIMGGNGENLVEGHLACNDAQDVVYGREGREDG